MTDTPFDQLRAITLTQPWATAMSIGYKKVETRDWKPPENAVGELMAIHAAKGFNGLRGLGVPMTLNGYRTLMQREPYFTIFRDSPLMGATTVHPSGSEETHVVYNPYAVIPRGTIVAVGRLGAVFPTEEARPRLESNGRDRELSLGNYDGGRFAWCFTDIVPVDIPAKGGRRLWWVPERESELAIKAWRTWTA